MIPLIIFKRKRQTFILEINHLQMWKLVMLQFRIVDKDTATCDS